MEFEHLKKTLKDRAIEKFSSGLIRLTGTTSANIHMNREVLDTLDGNYILATWHENIYYSCWLLRNNNYGSMISNSRDGELIARVMKNFAFEPIRGSSSKGGSRALREMVKFLKGPDPVAITPDGPKGPRHQVQSGVIMIARLTGVPIIPWSFEALDQIIISKSWDHHKIPKPFTIAVSGFGDPYRVPSGKMSDTDVEIHCRQLEQAMQANAQKVKDEIGKIRSEEGQHLLQKWQSIWKRKTQALGMN